MLVPITWMGVSTSSPQYGAENVWELQDISFDELNKHAITLGDKRDESMFVLARIKDEYMRFGFINITKHIDKKIEEVKAYVDEQILSLKDTLCQLNQSDSSENNLPEEE